MNNMNNTVDLRPVQPAERIAVMDMLRGFALLGILLVNMQFFAYPLLHGLFGLPPDTPAPDYAAHWFVAFAAQAKFYSLFSFLFGLGFTIIMERAAAKGYSVVPFFVRRMLVLLVLGLLHGIFIWSGDILGVYALIGLALLFLRNLQPRTLLITAVVMLAIPVLLQLAFTGMVEAAAHGTPESAAAIAQQAAEQHATMQETQQTAWTSYAEGGYGAAVAQRLTDLSMMYSFIWVFGWSILGMFLLGAYFGKRQLIRDAEQHLPLFRKLFWVGVLIGLPCAAWWATAGMPQYQAWPSFAILGPQIANALAAPLMALLYVSGFVLLSRCALWTRLLTPIGKLGRMALTNYIMQSVICTLIFYSYGLGYFGRPGALLMLGLTFAIWLAQIPFSVWWFSRYRFGPLEWVWRALTYWRLPVMRRAD